MRGLDFAFNDIGLALFTTLAPAATFAYIALALVALLARLGERERRCLESWLILPLGIVTVGLIASATHLGNPSNALYVLNAVGSSPLSTEVFCAVLFLGVSCSYWLACIYFAKMHALRSVWLSASIAGALLFLWGTTGAYAMPTVITWNTVLALATLPLLGLAGCAPVATLALVCSGQGHRRWLTRTLTAISAAATVLACGCMLAQNASLGELRNAFGTAADLVPFYPLAVGFFALCSAASLAGSIASLRTLRRAHTDTPVAFDRTSPAERRATWCLTAAVCMMYLGIFAVRFVFYCLHMTAGVI